MKTALEQAIQKVKDYPFLYTEDSIVSILTELLEAEKEQIIAAWKNGFSNGVQSVSRGEPKIKSADDYYQKNI